MDTNEKTYLIMFGDGEMITVEGYEMAEALALQAVNGALYQEGTVSIVDLSTGKVVESFENV